MSAQEAVPASTQTPVSTQSTPTNGSSQSSSPGGSRAVQLKRAMAGQPIDVQLSMLSPNAPVQRKGGEDTAGVHEAAAAGISSGGGALPHGDKIQQAFGAHDVSHVQAHTGSAASQANAAMGAEAYATGDHIAFGGAPDLHTTAHEAAHVVQQQAGVSLSGGVGQAGDAYEQHADAVADAVVAGKSAEPILSEMTGGAPASGDVQKRSVQRRAVQREETPPVTPAESTPTPTPTVAAPVDPIVAKEEAFTAQLTTTKAQAASVTDPSSLRAFCTSLPATATHESGHATTFATNQGVAAMMVGKLEAAQAGARAAWAAEDQAKALEGKPGTAASKELQFITNRLNLFKTSAPTGVAKTVNGATVARPLDVKNVMWDAIGANFDVVAPEEEADGALLDQIGGVYKAFDAGQFFGKMNPILKDAWNQHGGEAQWIGQLVNGGMVPVAPTGLEADPDFEPYVSKREVAFTGGIDGFISTANAMKNQQIIAADKVKVLELLGLQPGRYGSSKMILAAMGSAGAGAARGSTSGGAKPARLGKPSMFYTLAFPENIYVSQNRDYGLTSGDEPELQCTNMPAQAFLDGPLMVKS